MGRLTTSDFKKKQHKTQSSCLKTHSVHLLAGLYDHFRQHDA